MQHWRMLRRSMSPAECAIYELGAGGFITRSAASKLIMKKAGKTCLSNANSLMPSATRGAIEIYPQRVADLARGM
mgnify:CR=1 FL=1